MEDFEYRFFLCAHLSIVDGLSVYQVFPSELAALYSAYYSSRPSPLPELAVQFGDYAYWQRHQLQGEKLAPQIAYWRKQLAAPIPVLNWPMDRTRPARETFRGAIRPFALPKNLSEAIKALGEQEGVTLFMTLLAVFTTLLHCYTQQEDIIVGTPSPAGRKRSEVQKLLGYFLNPVALRFDLTGNPTFCELLRRTQRVTLEAGLLRGSGFGLLGAIQSLGDFVSSAAVGLVWTLVSPTAATANARIARTKPDANQPGLNTSGGCGEAVSAET